MSTIIKEQFLASWDKDLSDVWKHVLPVLGEIRHRSGNDAAASLCSFSKNWRTNKTEIRKRYELGVKEQKKREKEKEEKDGEEEKEDESKDSQSSESGDGHNNGTDNEQKMAPNQTDKNRPKSAKNSQNKRSASAKGDYQTQSGPLTSQQSYYNASIVYHPRPTSPLRQPRGSPYTHVSAAPRVRAQSPGKRVRPKSSKSRAVTMETHGTGSRDGDSHNRGGDSHIRSGGGDSHIRGETQQPGVQRQMREDKERIAELERQLAEMHSAHEQMEQDIKDLEADKVRLVDRVVELNEIKVAHDEQELQIKGVPERNSPLKVVREFELLWSNEWADAKVALDEYADWKVKDKDKYEILTSALMECFTMAEEAYANHRSVLIKLLNDPFAAARHPGKLKKRGSKEEDATDHENGNGEVHEMNSQATSTHKGELSPELEEAVVKYMKVQCDAIDFRHTSRYVIASAFATLHPLLIDHDIVKSARIKHFVRGALQLCWKMCLQSPPMSFDMEQVGGAYDDDRHELYPSSESSEAEGVVIDHYVYPAIMQGSDKYVQKALVCLSKPVEEEDEEY